MFYPWITRTLHECLYVIVERQESVCNITTTAAQAYLASLEVTPRATLYSHSLQNLQEK